MPWELEKQLHRYYHKWLCIRLRVYQLNNGLITAFTLNITLEEVLNMALSYKTRLKPEAEGGYTVNVPALPGCITYGENLQDAIQNASKAIELYVESLRAYNEDIPTDKDVLEYNLQLTA